MNHYDHAKKHGRHAVIMARSWHGSHIFPTRVYRLWPQRIKSWKWTTDEQYNKINEAHLEPQIEQNEQNPNLPKLMQQMLSTMPGENDELECIFYERGDADWPVTEINWNKFQRMSPTRLLTLVDTNDENCFNPSINRHVRSGRTVWPPPECNYDSEGTQLHSSQEQLAASHPNANFQSQQKIFQWVWLTVGTLPPCFFQQWTHRWEEVTIHL